ncbi:552_t:CDS:2 [Ambispora gerdemannii]|uniref:552_t:CDS:1 n=1 Tax=Ambispora gerdemannii TaxID=144530 RepID=A0A9N9CVB3_9GLOM|nr:552_t:CDS:2 [Ambispora gerdemannii]
MFELIDKNRKHWLHDYRYTWYRKDMLWFILFYGTMRRIKKKNGPNTHLELQRGGTFRVWYLNNYSEHVRNIITGRNQKTFASTDVFSLDNNILALYQITISTKHGIKDLKISNAFSGGDIA